MYVTDEEVFSAEAEDITGGAGDDGRHATLIDQQRDLCRGGKNTRKLIILSLYAAEFLFEDKLYNERQKKPLLQSDAL